MRFKFVLPSCKGEMVGYRVDLLAAMCSQNRHGAGKGKIRVRGRGSESESVLLLSPKRDRGSSTAAGDVLLNAAL